jgi:adenylate cyclase
VALKNINQPVAIWNWSPDAGDPVAPVAAVEKSEPAAPDKPSVAVLPFDCLSSDPEHGYLADGMTEDIITTLSKVSGLFVIARNSTFVFKGTAVDIRKVAQDLGVKYVLEGSMRVAGPRVRINAQLVEASGGHHLWADQFDGSMDDIFDVQDEITNKIVEALEVNLTTGEQTRIRRQRAGDPRLYEQLMRGYEDYNRFSRRTHAQAAETFTRMIEDYPAFVSGYFFLGFVHADQARWGWSDDPTASLATGAALMDKAVEIEPNDAEAVTGRGYLKMLRGDYDDALEDADRGVQLGPSHSDAMHVAAMITNYSGKPEEGASLAAQSARLSPMVPSKNLTELGHACWLLERYDDAVPPLRRVLAQTPHWQSARALLTLALLGLGRPGDAARSAKDIIRGNPRFSVADWGKTQPYRDQAILAHYLDGLRSAGLPD